MLEKAVDFFSVNFGEGIPTLKWQFAHLIVNSRS